METLLVISVERITATATIVRSVWATDLLAGHRRTDVDLIPDEAALMHRMGQLVPRLFPPAAAVPAEGSAAVVSSSTRRRRPTGRAVTRPVEPEPRRDWSTKSGAQALAELVRRYWRDHGFPDVEVWVEPLRGGREPLVVVKSRLGPDGLPPGSPAAS